MALGGARLVDWMVVGRDLLPSLATTAVRWASYSTSTGSLWWVGFSCSFQLLDMVEHVIDDLFHSQLSTCLTFCHIHLKVLCRLCGMGHGSEGGFYFIKVDSELRWGGASTMWEACIGF